MHIDKLSFHTLVDGIHEGWGRIPLHQRVARALEIIEGLEKKYGLGPDFDAMLDVVDSTRPLGCLAGTPGYETTDFERAKYQRHWGDQQTRIWNCLEVSILGNKDFAFWSPRLLTTCHYGGCAYLISVKTPVQHLLTIDRLGGQRPGTFNVMHRMNAAAMDCDTHIDWARGGYLIIPVVSAQKLRMPRRFVETVKHNKQCAPNDRINIHNDFPLRARDSSPGYLFLVIPLHLRYKMTQLFSIDGEDYRAPACDGVLTLFHGDPLVCTYASAINKDKCTWSGKWDTAVETLTPTVKRLVDEFVEVTEGWTSGALAEFPDGMARRRRS
ncbi:hypothetical protein CYLTODRAFT_445779 [Cylindrobasidium torrendii FP15055 ss-10]|uniref:Uncharacterized protein n=1 Tax=Cylindrobasidium torrendii FP15055 ss-10 TaxID=1314674 RepID=A0A0D7B5H9_9AGAR|nr:hypothetical protein CYLTODRAFT_445779 [Cylindrobasidium torrendii FP15055 ss-10]